MGQDSILEAMKEFSGRTLLAIRKGADGLFEKKLNDGIMIMVGSAVAHFDSDKQNKNVFGTAVQLQNGSPGLEVIVNSASWGQLIGWMKESFEDACTAGLDLECSIGNIENDPHAHAQGLVECTITSGYLPEELQFLTEVGKPVPLLSIARKLQEAWVPQEKSDDDEEDS